MPTWLLVICFALLRAPYIAMLNAFISWLIFELIAPTAIISNYGFNFLVWCIICFITSCIKIKKFF